MSGGYFIFFIGGKIEWKRNVQIDRNTPWNHKDVRTFTKQQQGIGHSSPTVHHNDLQLVFGWQPLRRPVFLRPAVRRRFIFFFEIQSTTINKVSHNKLI